MSPFSSFLQALRKRHNMRQSDLAAVMGYDQSLISALENGLKGPPTEQFVQCLVGTLQLSRTEEQELREALVASGRKLMIAADAPQDVYILIKELREKLPHLGPATVHTLLSVLSLGDRAKDAFDKPPRRARRPSREETAMP